MVIAATVATTIGMTVATSQVQRYSYTTFHTQGNTNVLYIKCRMYCKHAYQQFFLQFYKEFVQNIQISQYQNKHTKELSHGLVKSEDFNLLFSVKGVPSTWAINTEGSPPPVSKLARGMVERPLPVDLRVLAGLYLMSMSSIY